MFLGCRDRQGRSHASFLPVMLGNAEVLFLSRPPRSATSTPCIFPGRHARQHHRLASSPAATLGNITALHLPRPLRSAASPPCIFPGRHARQHLPRPPRSAIAKSCFCVGKYFGGANALVLLTNMTLTCRSKGVFNCLFSKLKRCNK